MPAETPSENPFELGEGELPYAQLQALSPLDVALPETLTRAQAIEKGHVNRLWAQEKNLQSVLYQNQNGTKTAYVFDKPVKYVDADGNIKDKNTTIAVTGIAGYAYAMTENSFSAYFGSTAANGVLIQYGDYTFSMKPETSLLVSTPTLGEDAKSVTYTNAFGAQTALRYETQISGVKEDIILMQNVGKYAFNFLLTASGLTPVQEENGNWMLVNSEQETVINFGSIVIKDSVGKTVYGTLNITPRASGGYIMTVTVPQEFLQSSDTVYPVYVDPTTVVHETGQYIQYVGSEASITEYEAIYDTTLIWHGATFGSSIGEHVLNTDSCAVLFFSDFYFTYGQFVGLEQYQIGKVTLYVHPLSCINSTFSARPRNSAPSWNLNVYEYYADQIIWDCSSVNSSTQEVHSCGIINCTSSTCSNNSDPISIDITEIARGWARYNSGESTETYENPSHGFSLFNEDTYDYDHITSVEDASGNSSVYYEIDYNEMGGVSYIKNIANSLLLKPKSIPTMSTEVLSENLQDNFKWILEYQGNAEFMIRSYSYPRRFLCAEADSGNTVGSAFVKTTDTTTSQNLTRDNFIWNILAPSNIGVLIKNPKTGLILFHDDDKIEDTENVYMVTQMQPSDSGYSKSAWAIMKVDDFVKPSLLTINETINWLNIGENFNTHFDYWPLNISWNVA